MSETVEWAIALSETVMWAIAMLVAPLELYCAMYLKTVFKNNLLRTILNNFQLALFIKILTRLSPIDSGLNH